MSYTYTPRREHIVISDDDSILMGFLRITINPSQAEWDIRSISLYATRELAETDGAVLADGIQMDELSPSGQMRVIAALNAWQHEQLERIHRLSVEASRAVSA